MPHRRTQADCGIPDLGSNEPLPKEVVRGGAPRRLAWVWTPERAACTLARACAHCWSLGSSSVRSVLAVRISSRAAFLLAKLSSRAAIVLAASSWFPRARSGRAAKTPTAVSTSSRPSVDAAVRRSSRRRRTRSVTCHPDWKWDAWDVHARAASVRPATRRLIAASCRRRAHRRRRGPRAAAQVSSRVRLASSACTRRTATTTGRRARERVRRPDRKARDATLRSPRASRASRAARSWTSRGAEGSDRARAASRPPTSRISEATRHPSRGGCARRARGLFRPVRRREERRARARRRDTAADEVRRIARRRVRRPARLLAVELGSLRFVTLREPRRLTAPLGRLMTETIDGRRRGGDGHGHGHGSGRGHR